MPDPAVVLVIDHISLVCFMPFCSSSAFKVSGTGISLMMDRSVCCGPSTIVKYQASTGKKRLPLKHCTAAGTYEPNFSFPGSQWFTDISCYFAVFQIKYSN